MAPFGHNGERAEVQDRLYKSKVISVGTSQIEAIGDVSTRDSNRQLIMIYNDSSSTVYYGPNGVTTSGSTKGMPIYKRQTVAFTIGDQAVYLIAGSASNDVIVQVMG